MSKPVKIVASGERDIVITRQFQAPRTLVWDAHTKPELIKRWLTGPDGWTMTVCEMDLCVGGKYRWEWSKTNGHSMGMGGEHLEIAAPERLVNTQLFDDDWTSGEAVGTLVLTEKTGVTTLTNTVQYSSPEARDAVLKSPMDEGIIVGYERLDGVLASLA